MPPPPRLRALLLALCLGPARAAVEQLRITLGRNSSEMVVSWATWAPGISHVRCARSRAALAAAPAVPSEGGARYHVAADADNVEYDSPYLHHARLENLAPNGEIYYY